MPGFIYFEVKYVSIHASSREDATPFFSHDCFLRLFQSTRPRGRTRLIACGQCSSSPVSIHASSREDATSIGNAVWNGRKFQSTRPRGRTRPCNSGFNNLQVRFNPRVLAGGRDCFRRMFALQTAVSIHASSREDATISISQYDYKA